jgi:hypothetical protein
LVSEHFCRLIACEADVVDDAGHGLQVAGENYLVSIDAKAEDLMQCVLKALGPGTAGAQRDLLNQDIG